MPMRKKSERAQSYFDGASDAVKVLEELADSARHPGGERTKVLLSVGEEDLKLIDEKASAANMSRSAYLVAMGRQGGAGVLAAVNTLLAELKSFREDGVHSEVRAARAEGDRLLAKMKNAKGVLTRLARLLDPKRDLDERDRNTAIAALNAAVGVLQP